jgi:hypothetical protein
MTLVKWLWAREPVLITILSSAGFWPALFYLLAAFGHPLTAMQQEALAGLGVIIAGGIIRGQVTPTSGATAAPAVSDVTRSSLTVLALCATLGAGGLVSGCAGSNKLVAAANAEHVAVTAVHAVVQAEAQAFRSGAYDNAHHQTYVAALLKVVQSEKALNDALMTWNAASGQPMPAVVSIAVQSLQKIIGDVTPLIPANSPVGSLVASANAAIAALTGGK